MGTKRENATGENCIPVEGEVGITARQGYAIIVQYAS